LKSILLWDMNSRFSVFASQSGPTFGWNWCNAHQWPGAGTLSRMAGISFSFRMIDLSIIGGKLRMRIAILGTK
jgi:hypothetical protein